jgi:hypothetical protein
MKNSNLKVLQCLYKDFQNVKTLDKEITLAYLDYYLHIDDEEIEKIHQKKFPNKPK